MSQQALSLRTIVDQLLCNGGGTYRRVPDGLVEHYPDNHIYYGVGGSVHEVSCRLQLAQVVATTSIGSVSQCHGYWLPEPIGDVEQAFPLSVEYDRTVCVYNRSANSGFRAIADCFAYDQKACHVKIAHQPGTDIYLADLERQGWLKTYNYGLEFVIRIHPVVAQLFGHKQPSESAILCGRKGRANTYVVDLSPEGLQWFWRAADFAPCTKIAVERLASWIHKR